MRALGFLLFALASGCQATPTNNVQAGEQRYCGERFSIAVAPSEKLLVDPKTPEDFILYRWERPSGNIAIYEGNHPQPGGIVFEVEKSKWPSVVVVHGTKEDARSVKIFDNRPANCLKPQSLGSAVASSNAEGEKQ